MFVFILSFVYIIFTMKISRKFPIVCLITMLLFQSCGSYRIFTGTIQHDASGRNDIIKSRELKSYLESRSQIKFVLRTPSGFDNFSEEEKTEWKEVFSQIEKKLIIKGHTVKDRVLLDLLIEKGDMSLADVGKAINTDIIIELINIDFDIPNEVKSFYIKEKGIKTNFSIWNNINFVDCRIAMMECRITLVEIGNVGGIFKFYISGCDAENNFYVRLYEDWSGDLNPEKESYIGWNSGNVTFKSLTHTYNMNNISRNKAIEKLVDALLDNLK